MSQIQEARPLHQRIASLRWVIILVILSLVALHQLMLWVVLRWVPVTYQAWLAVAFDGLLGGLVVWFALNWLVKNIAQQEQTETELRLAYDKLAETHRQLLAVHDIGCEIASATEMQQVLELAARAPTHLTSAMGSTIVTFDHEQDRLKLDMAWGLSDTYLHSLRRRMEAGISAVRCHDCTLLKARLANDCTLFQGMEEVAQREGIQSLICLPLMRNQKRDGIISAYFPSPGGPPEEQIQLLNIVATEIASTLEGARMRTSQMATLYAVENLTRTGQNLDDLLVQVLETTLAGWGARRGVILLYDQAEDTWHHWTQRGLADDPNHPQFELALHLAEKVRQDRRPILIPDLSQYPAWHPTGDAGPGSAAVAPLVTGQEMLGALVIMANRPHLFQPRQAPLFSAIAHQATLAINNAQLHAQVQQMAMLEERYRLSREIHDGLAQTLSSLGWQLDHLKDLLAKSDLNRLEKELVIGRQMVGEAYMDVREAIDGLRLQNDQTSGLATVLQEYADDFKDRTGIQVTLELKAEPTLLSAETELQLLRIVQEALINVRKHACAEHVWIRLHHHDHDGRLALTIADDGCGFDPALPRGRKHLGLATMRERAQSQGCDFSIVTGPEQGTRLTVTLPS